MVEEASAKPDAAGVCGPLGVPGAPGVRGLFGVRGAFGVAGRSGPRRVRGPRGVRRARGAGESLGGLGSWLARCSRPCRPRRCRSPGGHPVAGTARRATAPATRWRPGRPSPGPRRPLWRQPVWRQPGQSWRRGRSWRRGAGTDGVEGRYPGAWTHGLARWARAVSRIGVPRWEGLTWLGPPGKSGRLGRRTGRSRRSPARTRAVSRPRRARRSPLVSGRRCGVVRRPVHAARATRCPARSVGHPARMPRRRSHGSRPGRRTPALVRPWDRRADRPLSRRSPGSPPDRGAGPRRRGRAGGYRAAERRPGPAHGPVAEISPRRAGGRPRRAGPGLWAGRAG